MSNTIRISNLNSIAQITSDDFIPVVDSGSLTTYKTQVQSFGTWMYASGSASYAESSRSSSFSTNASASKVSISSSYAVSASYVLANISVVNSTYSVSASFASNAVSASYSKIASNATSSNSSSYLVYPNNSTASYSMNSNSSSYATSASIATTASYALLTSGQVTSASYSDKSRNADTASYLSSTLVGSSGFLGAGQTWQIANPLGAFYYNGYMYVMRYNRGNSCTTIVKINIVTNQVTFVVNLGAILSDAANADFSTLVCMLNDGTGLQPYAVIVSSIWTRFLNLNTNVIMKFSLAPGEPHGSIRFDQPVCVSGNLTDGTGITMTAFRCGYNSNNESNLGMKHIRKWTSVYKFNVGAGTYTSSTRVQSTPFNFFAIDSTVMEFYQNTNGTAYAGDITPIMMEYNPILKRYYWMDILLGCMHIFQHTVGDIITNFDANSIAYVKTISIAMPPQLEQSSVDNERWSVYYDLNTGKELGLIFTSRGNVNIYGSVLFINWPDKS